MNKEGFRGTTALFLAALLILAASFFSSTPEPFAVRKIIAPRAASAEADSPSDSALLPPIPARALPAGGIFSSPENFAPGELLVLLRPDVSPVTVRMTHEHIADMQQLLPERDDNLAQLYLVKAGSSRDADDLLPALQRDSSVVFAERNYLRPVTQAVNDPLYPQQWHLPKVKADQAWSAVRSTRPVVLAVIDTDINWTHEDLIGNMWNNPDEIQGNNIDDDGNGKIDDIVGWDFFVGGSWCIYGEDCGIPDNNPHGIFNHGTHVAGIAAAVTNNGIGVAGACPQCKIMGLRAGYAYAPPLSGVIGLMVDSAIAQALVYAADEGADIASMSFGGIYPSQTMKIALDYAAQRGVILVAAAGNGNNDIPLYPAAYEGVLSVAATDQNDQRASFSGYSMYGMNGTIVDAAAPGVNILSTAIKGSPYGCADPDADGYSLCSGTSMSTPLVAGIIGLLLSKTPSLPPERAWTFVRSADDPVTSPGKYIAQRINAYKAVQLSRTTALLYHPHFYYGSDPIALRGTAAGQGFQSYRLEIGPGVYPSAWTTVATSSLPVAGGVLSTIDPVGLGLSPGVYTLRLVVMSNQQTYEDAALVYIDPTLASGWPKQLNVQRCLDTPASMSKPAMIDIDGILGDEIFFIINEPGVGLQCQKKLYGLRGDGSILPGFPTPVGPFNSNWVEDVTAADIDNDGMTEIATTTYCSGGCPTEFSQFLVFQEDSTLQPGWPVSLPTTPTFPYPQPTAVIANVDGGSDLELIFVTSTALSPACTGGHYVYVYKQNGQPLPGWPQQIACSTFDNAPPAVGDLDNDGDMEIVLASKYFTGTPQVYVFNHDGTPFPGWPKSLNGGMPITLADIDRNDNNKLELVVMALLSNANGLLYVLNHDGTTVPGWPAYLPIGAISSLTDLAVANFDPSDEYPEIVAMGGNRMLTLLNHDGTTVPGWPVAVPPAVSAASLAVADLEGDGTYEILLTAGYVPLPIPPSARVPFVAYHADGTIVNGFPKIIDDTFNAATAGDMNGDGKVDVFVMDDNGLMYLWDYTALASPATLPWSHFRQGPQRTGQALAPPPDTSPPAVQILNPPAGSTLPNGGFVNVDVSATDPSGIASIKIYIDNALKKTCAGATFCSYKWHMNTASSGQHVVNGTATDGAPAQNTGGTTITVTKP